MNSFRFQIALFLLFFGLSSISYAQKGVLKSSFSQGSSGFQSTKSTDSNDSIQSHFAIKINPLLFASELMQIQFDLPIHKTGSAIVQFGYRNSDVYSTLFDDNRQYIEYSNASTGNTEQIRYSCKGFQVGIGYKQLFKNDWFLQSLFFYKQYNYIFSSPGHWYSTELFITGGVSETEQRDSFVKYVKATTLMVGKTLSHKHLSIDIYGGVGYRLKKRIIASYNDWGVDYTSADENLVQNRQTISLHLGLNIGYSF